MYIAQSNTNHYDLNLWEIRPFNIYFWIRSSARGSTDAKSKSVAEP